MPEIKKRRRAPRVAAFFFTVLLMPLAGYLALVHPKTPLPPEWNPIAPLRITDPVTPLTQWKLNHVLANDALCLATLGQTADFDRLPDLEESPVCSIIPQVNLRNTGLAAVKPVRTRCQTALRLAMWDHHGVQPAAQTHLGTTVNSIRHFSSYSCREMRTGRDGRPRMSTHATADSIDISGFTLGDGRQVSLLNDWSEAAGKSNFLRAVRDSACQWFVVTLGPEYNALHADHFHLQHTGWGLCR